MSSPFVRIPNSHRVALAMGLVLSTGLCLAQSLAITGAVAYPNASGKPIRPATVLTKDGRIVAVGSQLSIPAGYEVIRCEGCAIVAGFWNGHVHFTEPKWDKAAELRADKLTSQLQE